MSVRRAENEISERENCHMKKTLMSVGCIVFSIFILAITSLAQTSFRVKRMTRGDVPKGQGQCEIRLQVDKQVEISLQEDMLAVRNISGNGAQDAGCECNMPLPRWNLQGFHFEVIGARGKVELLEEPSARNGFRSIFGITDPSGGAGRYHIRVTWNAANSGGTPPSQGRDSYWGQSGENWNRGGDLRILNALYGVPGYYRDVTSALQRLAQNNRINIQITNENMGVDPAPSSKKELVVLYEYRGGELQSVWLREGDSLNIPNTGRR
jgi:hypothetical protein